MNQTKFCNQKLINVKLIIIHINKNNNNHLNHPHNHNKNNNNDDIQKYNSEKNHAGNHVY